MRGTVADKVLQPLRGQPVFAHSLTAFQRFGPVSTVVIVHRDEHQRAQIGDALAAIDTTGLAIQFAAGGQERQDSVFNGLSELSLLIEHVFIHDCARPLLRDDNLNALYEAVLSDGAAVLAHRVTDTIKRVGATKRTLRRRKLRDLPRSSLWAMETPQVFERETILEAYRRLRYEGKSVTDDTAALSQMGRAVTLVENPHPNPKITRPGDVEYVEFLLNR